MEQREMGLLFRKGWVSRQIIRVVGLFIVADALIKYQYGIQRTYNFNTTRWKWWLEKSPEERERITLESAASYPK